MGALFACVLTALVCGAGIARADEAPAILGEDPLETKNGAVLLRWEAGEHSEHDELEYELQEAATPDFAEPHTRYRGTLPSWYVSGRLDGRSYFRVRSRVIGEQGPGAWSEWSASRELVVAHHDLGLALGLFALGALIFAVTLGTVLVGIRSTKEAA